MLCFAQNPQAAWLAGNSDKTGLGRGQCVAGYEGLGVCHGYASIPPQAAELIR